MELDTSTFLVTQSMVEVSNGLMRSSIAEVSKLIRLGGLMQTKQSFLQRFVLSGSGNLGVVHVVAAGVIPHTKSIGRAWTKSSTALAPG